MADDSTPRPKPRFPEWPARKGKLSDPQEPLPRGKQEPVDGVPEDSPEWIYIAARVLAAKHTDRHLDRRVQYEEWLRLLVGFREGLIAAGLPDWMAMSNIMGVLDHDLGKAVDTLVRSMPHMAHAAIRANEGKGDKAWMRQLRDRSVLARHVVGHAIRDGLSADTALDRVAEVINNAARESYNSGPMTTPPDKGDKT